MYDIISSEVELTSLLVYDLNLIMSVEIRVDIAQPFSFEGPPPQSPAFITLEPGERVTILARIDGYGFELERQRRQVHTGFNLNRELGIVSHGSVIVPLTAMEEIVLATLEDNIHSTVDPMIFREALYPRATDLEYSRREMQEILKVCIARVRRKLPYGPFNSSHGGNEHYIHSVRAVGYMLYDPSGDGYTDELHRGLSLDSNESSSMS